MAKPAQHVAAKTLQAFLQRHIAAEDSALITDEYRGYRRMGEWISHMTINHAKAYVEGLVHTNTIESFWSLVKRAVCGQHHHYSREYAAAYLIESCYKYNIRNDVNQFENFLAAAVSV